MPGPRIPELEKSLCGCSLKLGSKIVAVIFIVFWSFFLIISFGVLFYNEFENERSKIGAQVVIVQYGLMAVVSGLMTAISAFMYYGVEKHEETYILAWCILTTAFTAIYLFFILTRFYFEHFFNYFQGISLALIASSTYAVLVAYSHFRELRREKNNPTVFTNAE